METTETPTKTRNVEVYGAVAVLVTFEEDAAENVVGTPTFSTPFLDDASVLWELAECGGYDTDAEEWVHLPDQIVVAGAEHATADVAALDDLARLLTYGLAEDGTWDGGADHLDAVAAIVGRVRTIRDLDADEIAAEKVADDRDTLAAIG